MSWKFWFTLDVPRGSLFPNCKIFAFPSQNLRPNVSQAELSLLLSPLLYLLAASQASLHFQPGWVLRLQIFLLFLLPCTPMPMSANSPGVPDSLS